MQNSWLDSLDEDTRLKALKMIGQMKELGADDAESWVRSEILEDLPQMTQFLILNKLWQEIDSFSKNVSTWTKHAIEDSEKRPNSHFAESGFALKRILELGVSLSDIGSIAKLVAFESIFGTINVLEEGNDSENLPSWELIEIDSEGNPTGRNLQGLHESLLER